jgi:MEDS: MEthanogen/methylotroph, DcmR Sensory domain
MAQNSKQVTLARSEVDRRCHVCAFFHSREDEYKVMLPFLKEGLEAGEKVFQIIDQRQRDERLRRLTDAGVDAAAAEQNGLLEVRSWENAHLSDGRFDQHAMIALVEGIAKDGEKRSGVTRLWANMEWALEDFPGVHDLLEYESRINYMLPKYDMATVCTYDLAKFSAAIVMDVLRTHPKVIVGGILRENPFYVPPDEFLRDLRDRGSAAH